MNHGERLTQLNDRAGERSVWDSVDRPIRPLVYYLNRLGFKTIWSCCGFAYDSEEEPKSHANYTYVVFEPTSLEKLSWLTKIAQDTKAFTVQSHHQDPAAKRSWWIMTSRAWNEAGKTREKQWVSEIPGTGTIHDYEEPLLLIYEMVNRLKRAVGFDIGHSDSIRMYVPLKDGNAVQREMMDPEFRNEWQVEPKTG